MAPKNLGTDLNRSTTLQSNLRTPNSSQRLQKNTKPEKWLNFIPKEINLSIDSESKITRWNLEIIVRLQRFIDFGKN